MRTSGMGRPAVSLTVPESEYSVTVEEGPVSWRLGSSSPHPNAITMSNGMIGVLFNPVRSADAIINLSRPPRRDEEIDIRRRIGADDTRGSRGRIALQLAYLGERFRRCNLVPRRE